MKLEVFLMFCEAAYWEISNTDIQPALVGFFFALSEYYIVATEEANREKQYDVMDIKYHDDAVKRVQKTYDEYHHHWNKETERGYLAGMRFIDEIESQGLYDDSANNKS